MSSPAESHDASHARLADALLREIIEADVMVRISALRRRRLLLEANEAGVPTRRLAEIMGNTSPSTIHLWVRTARSERDGNKADPQS